MSKSLKFTRRDLIKTGVAATAVASIGAPALAQGGYPNKPLQIVVPFNPGGGADRTMRLFAPYLAKELGQPVNVVNKPGGSGWVAWADAAKWDGEADDHMLQLVNLPHVFSYMDPRMKREETLDSFNFLCWHSYDPANFTVRDGDDRFPNIEAFVKYVQDNPGEVTISTTAVGSDNHMTVAFCEKFLDNFEVKKLYASGDEKKIQELLGEISDCAAANTGYYIPYMLEGQMRAICVFHDERWPTIPNVPTFEEVFGKRNVAGAGRTLAVANGLADNKRKVLLEAIDKAINNPEYKIRELENRNALLYLTGDEMESRLAEFRDVVAEVKYWEAEE